MKLAIVAALLATATAWVLPQIVERPAATAGFWFESVSYESSVLGGPLTAADVDAIARVAREELANAFDGFRITLSERRDARYRVRVVQELVSQAMHRKTWIAGQAYASGFGGAGEVSFLYFASGAQAYAPPDLPRSELIAAIGRGIGRGAAHEFAHLIGYAAHSSRDRGSYEYHAASRSEQYFGPMHWETARPVLEKRLGRRVMEAGTEAQTDEQLIRDTRARSNAAIAAHDLAGIARAWVNDVHVVSSTSTQTAGSQANQQRMARQFETRPDTIYVRTPSTIDVYSPWNVASERGEWIGRWTEPDGNLEIGGTYLAQWRRVEGRWMIQAELYVPTHCRGSKYCSQRP